MIFSKIKKGLITIFNQKNMAKNILQQDLVTELGLENLPADKKDALMVQAAEVLNTQISLRLREELVDKDLEEFDRLWQDGSEEDIKKFIADKVPKLDNIVAEEVADFKKSIIETANWAKDEVMKEDEQKEEQNNNPLDLNYRKLPLRAVLIYSLL